MIKLYKFSVVVKISEELGTWKFHSGV